MVLVFPGSIKFISELARRCCSAAISGAAKISRVIVLGIPNRMLKRSFVLYKLISSSAHPNSKTRSDRSCEKKSKRKQQQHRVMTIDVISVLLYSQVSLFDFPMQIANVTYILSTIK